MAYETEVICNYEFHLVKAENLHRMDFVLHLTGGS